MPLSFNRLVHGIAFVTLLALLTTACSPRSDALTGPLAQNTPLPNATQSPSTTADEAVAAQANRTAQDALRAAAEIVQGTPTEAEIQAADGVPPTRPVLTEGPSVVIAPTAGSANTQVVVSGSGFPANVRVDVYLAGLATAASAASVPQSYANTITDVSGNYRITFVMPSVWPDGTPIERGRLGVLVTTQDFATRATASFDYTPLAPTQTPVPATATWTPAPTTVPTATPTPARNPFVEVTPLSGSGNAQLTLRGGGFPANTVVNVQLGTFDAQVGGGGGIMRYGSTQTDGSGNFTLSFTMPTVWPDNTPVEPGKLLILVATEDFNRQASAVFDYLAPTPTPSLNPYAQADPTSGTANTQVTIRGGGFTANTRINLYLSGFVNASTAEGTPNSYATTTTDAAGNYQMSFTMPSTWPDGTPIESGKLALLVATENFAQRANVTFDYMAPVPTAVSTPGWEARYYDNPSLRNEPILVRNEPDIHFYWGTGSPDPILPSDQFSVSWQRTVTFESGLYRFTIEMDDGARLYLDNLLILESWRQGARRTLSVDYPVSSGAHTIRLDYFEDRGEALVNLRWLRLAGTEPVPTATPGAPGAGVLFSNDPRTNRRHVNQYFCSGFESECEFSGCTRNYRLVWGPYCREGDYPYIQPGLYRVSLYGMGPVRAGATDYGETHQLFAFGLHEFELPGSFTFCWSGRAANGYGFETIVQSTGVYAAVDWITIEYLGARCP